MTIDERVARLTLNCLLNEQVLKRHLDVLLKIATSEKSGVDCI